MANDGRHGTAAAWCSCYAGGQTAALESSPLCGVQNQSRQGAVKRPQLASSAPVRAADIRTTYDGHTTLAQQRRRPSNLPNCCGHFPHTRKDAVWCRLVSCWQAGERAWDLCLRADKQLVRPALGSSAEVCLTTNVQPRLFAKLTQINHSIMTSFPPIGRHSGRPVPRPAPTSSATPAASCASIAGSRTTTPCVLQGVPAGPSSSAPEIVTTKGEWPLCSCAPVRCSNCGSDQRRHRMQIAGFNGTGALGFRRSTPWPHSQPQPLACVCCRRLHLSPLPASAVRPCTACGQVRRLGACTVRRMGSSRGGCAAAA